MEDVNMKCPYCDKEMENGYIRAHSGWMNINWQSYTEYKKVKIYPWTNNFTRCKMDDIYYCEDCQIIMKKLSDKKRNGVKNESDV